MRDATAVPSYMTQPHEAPHTRSVEMGTDPRSLLRADFDHVVRLGTRSSDNDTYGHLNNSIYFQLFDTAITGWLNHGVGATVTTLPARGVVVNTRYAEFTPGRWPSNPDVRARARLERLGRTSVTYNVALFAAGRNEISAFGHWVHVYVDPAERPTGSYSGRGTGHARSVNHTVEATTTR